MLAFIILALINIMILLQTKKTSSGGGKGWTVYGTMGCGWTRKQLEYFNNTKRHYVFINCNEESCDNIDGFPYIIHPDGEISIGYTEF